MHDDDSCRSVPQSDTTRDKHTMIDTNFTPTLETDDYSHVLSDKTTASSPTCVAADENTLTHLTSIPKDIWEFEI